MRGGVARSGDVGGNNEGAFLFHHRGDGGVFGFVSAAAREGGGKQGCGKQRLGEGMELHDAFELD